jgi:hypothetical protein
MPQIPQLRQLLFVMTVATIPFAGYYIPTGFVSLSVTNVLILVSGFVLSLELYSESKLKTTVPQIIVSGLFIVVLLSGVIISFTEHGSFRRFVTIAGHLLLIMLIGIGVKNKTELRQLIHTVFLSSIFVASIAIISSIFTINFGGGFHNARSIFGFSIPFIRTSGIPLSHGEFGMYTLSTVPLYAVYGLRSRNPLHLGGVGIIVFSIIFILQSRSTWIALFAGYATMILFFRSDLLLNDSLAKKLAVLRKVGLAITPAVGVGLVWVVIRIGGSIDLRIQQIVTSIQLMIRQPFGYGWGNIQIFFERNALPHNAFLRHGVETGIVSFFAFIAIYIIVMRDLMRDISSQEVESHLVALGLFAGLAIVLVEANNLIGFGKAGWMWVAFSLAFHRTNQS